MRSNPLFAATLLTLVSVVHLPAAVGAPADWIPMRWEMASQLSLDILQGTPVNCLLIPWNGSEAGGRDRLVSQIHTRKIAVLALLALGDSGVTQTKDALRGGVDGIVLEGDWTSSRAEAIRALVHSSVPVIELAKRARMNFDSAQPILGTYQGVWPGIHLIDETGSAEASATGSSWIYTNSGFLRAAHAMTASSIWLSVRPPGNTAVSTTQYLQAIADCETMAAHWVITLDPLLTAALKRREPGALKTWTEMGRMLAFFTSNQKWRSYLPFSRLVVIQGPQQGALLTGGVADMIGASHTPVQILPPWKLRAGSLTGSSVVLNIGSRTLAAAQQKIVRDYTEGGGVVFDPPASWSKIASGAGGRVILDHRDAKQLGGAWQDLIQTIRQRPLGVTLFNVPSILFNLLQNEARNQVVLELTNYQDYPAENVTVHLAGKWRTVRLVEPGKLPRPLEIYPVKEDTGVDLDQMGTVAVLEAER
jgi:hypothetical protein